MRLDNIYHKATSDLRLHPRADEVPTMTPDEYDELVEDIEARGIIEPIITTKDFVILDGRHRWQAACALGLDEVLARPAFDLDPADEFAFMVKAAIMRRHLTTAQRKQLAEKLIVSDPSKSDRQVAKATGISPTTVGKVRSEAEAAGDVSRLDTRTDSKGREQPASKPVKVHIIKDETPPPEPVMVHITKDETPPPEPVKLHVVKEDRPPVPPGRFQLRTRHMTPREYEEEQQRAEGPTWRAGLWAILDNVLKTLAKLSEIPADKVAAVTPAHRRASTAKRLRAMGRYLGAVAVVLEDAVAETQR